MTTNNKTTKTMYTLFGLIWVFTSVSGARPARSDHALKVRLDRVIDRALGEARNRWNCCVDSKGRPCDL
jgi:hypothetical protein